MGGLVSLPRVRDRNPPFSRHLSNSRTGDLADSWPGGQEGGGSPGRSDHSAPTLFGMACGVRGGRQGGAPATHRKAEMLPIVAVQFMMPLFQSRVNHQLVTSPMVVPPGNFTSVFPMYWILFSF